jgi:2-aminoadipate transaminase
MFWLDRSKPLTDQILYRLIEAIESGEMSRGMRLPSIRTLAAQLEVNRNTVAHAYQELAEKGYVTTRYGGGTVVSSQVAALTTSASRSIWSKTRSPALTAVDWERRLSRRLKIFLSQRSVPQARTTQRKPINLLHMRPNTDLFPLDRFRQCLNTVLRRSGNRLLNYGSPAGYLPLREQIANRLQVSRIPSDPNRILIFSGSQQGIDLLARAFLDEGDEVVVESPMYSIALKILEFHRVRLYPYLVGANGVSFESLENLPPGYSIKLFYAVPNFQNPTTHSYNLEERIDLLQHVYRLDSVLIEDASDAELHEEAGAESPSLAALDRAERVIYLNTFSKTLVPSVRVGYVCVPTVLIGKLTELKEMTDLSHSLIIQAAVAEFMERGLFDQHVERVRKFYQDKMERVLDMLGASLPQDTPFTRPQGGMCVWVDLPEHMDSIRLFENLRAKGVLVSPGALCQPVRQTRNGLRLCVANESESRLAEGFRILGSELELALRQPPPTPQEQEYQSMH